MIYKKMIAQKSGVCCRVQTSCYIERSIILPIHYNKVDRIVFLFMFCLRFRVKANFLEHTQNILITRDYDDIVNFIKTCY